MANDIDIDVDVNDWVLPQVEDDWPPILGDLAEQTLASPDLDSERENLDAGTLFTLITQIFGLFSTNCAQPQVKDRVRAVARTRAGKASLKGFLAQRKVDRLLRKGGVKNAQQRDKLIAGMVRTGVESIDTPAVKAAFTKMGRRRRAT